MAHPWFMRRFALLCLAPALWAGGGRDLPTPGRDAAFLARLMPEQAERPDRPWHTFREPLIQGSAVVEVVGELTAEEWRQVRFNEFLAWFRADLRAFLKAHADGGAFPAAAQAAGPGPRLVPLARAGF